MSLLSPRICDVTLQIAVPVHMELFNRVVEAYPCTSTGSLSSYQSKGDSGGIFELELIILRKYAEYAIHVQRHFPVVPLITARFRANLGRVTSALQATLCNPSMVRYVADLMPCPGGEVASERDLSSVTCSELWAIEMVRLEGHLISGKGARNDLMGSLYDHCTLIWARNELAKLLQVDVVSGWDLYSRAVSVIDVIGNEDLRKLTMGPEV
ncbi:hypothetical protein VNI00_011120 [Paramarasmius palmivorus]|uniref:Uncharacterized protein n=1 Tax=Paramarasmius palmivorus TaxID=297713 RepID=A0AAW0CEV5_9AGAR